MRHDNVNRSECKSNLNHLLFFSPLLLLPSWSRVSNFTKYIKYLNLFDMFMEPSSNEFLMNDHEYYICYSRHDILITSLVDATPNAHKASKGNHTSFNTNSNSWERKMVQDYMLIIHHLHSSSLFKTNTQSNTS